MANFVSLLKNGVAEGVASEVNDFMIDFSVNYNTLTNKVYNEPFRKAFYSVIKIVAITFGLVILLGRRNQGEEGHTYVCCLLRSIFECHVNFHKSRQTGCQMK